MSRELGLHALVALLSATLSCRDASETPKPVPVPVPVPAPVPSIDERVKALLEASEAWGDNEVALGPDAVPALMELARGASEPTSTRAIQVLGRIGDARALPLLLAIAQPESAAENAALAYGPEVVDALLDALRREETYPAALRLLERIAPADDLPSMLAEAYATIEGDQRWGVANTVFRLSTDIYIEELAAAEQDRISKLIDDNPVVAVRQAFRLAEAYPDAKALVAEVLTRGDFHAQRTALRELSYGKLSPASFLPELRQTLNNPIFEDATEEVLAGIDSEQARAIVDDHFDDTFRKLTGIEPAAFAFDSPPTGERLLAPRKGERWSLDGAGAPRRVLVTLDDARDIRRMGETTLVTREGIRHLTLGYVKRNCRWVCEEPLDECRAVLVYRLPKDIEALTDPMFLFPGTLAFTDLRESAFVNAPSTNSDCRTSRLLDFEKSECNSGTILSYRGKNVLTTNADYTGGPIELPFSVSYQGHRYFLLDAIDKVHPVYGWVSLRGDAIERELSGEANPICDGGFGGPIARSGIRRDRAPASAQLEARAVRAVRAAHERRKSGDSTRERSRRDCRDAPGTSVWTPIMYTSDITWQEGPVETARYGEGCSDGFWPSPGDACHLRIGGFRYRLGSTVQQQAWAGGTRSVYSLLVWRDTPSPAQDQLDPKPRELALRVEQVDISQVRIVFAGDLARRAGLDFILQLRVAERRTLLRTLQPVRRSRRSFTTMTRTRAFVLGGQAVM